MSKSIDYVICAAGKGERFRVHGIRTPKALIKLSGITLLERSLMSLDFYENDRLILITQKEDKVKFCISKRLEELYPFLDIVWLEIDQATSGQLETFYLAKKYLRVKEASVAIFNCDTHFKSKELYRLIQDESIQGIIPCAEADGESWSFCKINSRNEVVDIQEKLRISKWATVGFYFFRDTNKLLKLTRESLNSVQRDERYVAPLYQAYIKNKEVIKICHAQVFLPMGTLEQVKDYWSIALDDMINMNSSKTIVVDLDDTITIDKSSSLYDTKKPNKKIIKMLQKYKSQGFEIIIYTARNMKTQKGKEDRVLANVGAVTLEWLKKHKVPCDGIKFGKPYAENGFYIDDRAIRPKEFLELKYEEIITLLKDK